MAAKLKFRELLELEKLPVVIDDQCATVLSYRARGASFDYSHQIDRNYSNPFYKSNKILPKKKVRMDCKVLFPESFFLKKKYVVVSTTKKSMAKSVIKKAFDIFHIKKNTDDFILKIYSLNEFIPNDELVWSSKSIRHCIQKDEEIVIEIIDLEENKELSENSKEKEIEKNNLQYKEITKEEEARKVLKDNDFLFKTHKEKKYFQTEYITFENLSLPFKVDIVEAEINSELNMIKAQIYAKIFLFYGDHLIKKSVSQTPVGIWKGENHIIWVNENYNPRKHYHLNSLPRATKIAFVLYKKIEDIEKIVISWVITNLVDEQGLLATGLKHFKMWSPTPEMVEDSNFDSFHLLTACKNMSKIDYEVISISVKFQEFLYPVFVPKVVDYSDSVFKKPIVTKDSEKLKVGEREKLNKIYAKKLIKKLDKSDKILIFKDRENMVNRSELLEFFLRSVNWKNPWQVNEARKIFLMWKKPKHTRNWMSFLGVNIHDIVVREEAVKHLASMSDEELKLYMIQFAQILKIEPYHDSAICRLLIERSVKNPLGLGHYFFWNLNSEIKNPYYSERIYLILEEYLYKSGTHYKYLINQKIVVDKLKETSIETAKIEKKLNGQRSLCKEHYRKLINNLNSEFFPSIEGKYFQLVVDPRIECKNLIVEKSKYMDSKKKPLFLAFNTRVEDCPKCVIFKVGDDLRQDTLTLQLLEVMEQIWQSEGLDLKILLYECISTGNEIGMIEVVHNAETLSKIQINHGGGAMGALKDHTIDSFLRECNPEENDYERARKNFVVTCAGYSVATYVLGIGDRHSSNIMLTRNGKFFHIDFGHFLGNFKVKMGYRRERTPFAFTPEMAFVMGGKKYENHYLFEKFKILCSKAFTILRKHHVLLVDLLKLMLPAGIPELKSHECIDYFVQKLQLNKTETEAQQILQRDIKTTLNAFSRKLDNMIHNMKRK